MKTFQTIGTRSSKLLLIFVLSINTALAVSPRNGCDWSTIVPIDNSFKYNEACHKEVGRMVRDSDLAYQQIVELEATIKAKDEIIAKQEGLVYKWRNEAYDLEDRLDKIEDRNDFKNWIYFGLGYLAMGASVYAAVKVMQP